MDFFTVRVFHQWKSEMLLVGYSGGAAVTCKNELEMVNEEILQKVSEQLRQAMIASSEKPPGMDWSKRSGGSEICCNPEEFGDHSAMECSPFIVVHGAGSLSSFSFFLCFEVSFFFPNNNNNIKNKNSIRIVNTLTR